METSRSSLPSRIASLVHTHFDALPSRSKPTIYPDGSREWVPMSAIVVSKGMYSNFYTSLFPCSVPLFCVANDGLLRIWKP